MPHGRWLIKLLNEYSQRGKEEREGGREGKRGEWRKGERNRGRKGGGEGEKEKKKK